MPTQAEKKRRQEKFLYFLSCSYTRFLLLQNKPGPPSTVPQERNPPLKIRKNKSELWGLPWRCSG